MKQSAGILVYREKDGKVEVLLAHPGGPFWAKKDVWTIPKGELDDGEEDLSAAKREFEEELGFRPPVGEFIDLGSSKQSGGKTNYIWAVEGDPDLNKFVCHSTFSIEWPPRSGQQQEFVEIDRISWFGLAKARSKVFPAQAIFIDRLAQQLGENLSDSGESHQTSLL